MKLLVFIRMVYGQPKLYPANPTAEQFARLLNVKTFNREQLRLIGELGIAIEQAGDPAAQLQEVAA